MKVFFYLAPIIICLVSVAGKLHTRTQLLFGAGLIAKLAFAYIMTYLIINHYDFGDLPTYYTFAKNLSLGQDGSEVNLLWGTHIVAVLNSFVFDIFPPSIYGLATISGISSFYYSYALIRSFDGLLTKSHFFGAIVLLMFLPVLGTQSGYIGKETYILPLLGYVFYTYRLEQKVTVWIAISIIGIGMIRPYQAFIIIVSFIFASILVAGGRGRMKVLLVMLLVLAAVLLFFGSWLANQLRIISEVGYETFLADTYSGGNLMLDPFPQPFTILQNFRPFFWESHNFMSMFASAENMIPLAFGATFFFLCIMRRYLRSHLKSNPFLLFITIYTILNLFIFMYNSNVGDLARRHIYYYPQLILLGYFSLSAGKMLRNNIVGRQ